MPEAEIARRRAGLEGARARAHTRGVLAKYARTRVVGQLGAVTDRVEEAP